MIKLYNTKDQTDANKIYDHWILEANNGEIIEFYTGKKRVKFKIKNGKSDMAVLKPDSNSNKDSNSKTKYNKRTGAT